MLGGRKVACEPDAAAWRPILAAAVSGGLMVLAVPGVVPVKVCAWLAWIALAPLTIALSSARPAQGAWLGWIAGFVFNSGACAWFPPLIARFTKWPPALAIGAAVLLWAYHALPWAAWGAFVALAGRTAWAPFFTATSFVVLERWMPVVFPASLGLTQYEHLRVAQVAELGGPFAVTFLLVFFAAAVGAMTKSLIAHRRLRWTLVITSIGLCGSTALFGTLRLHAIQQERAAASTLHVGLVQGDTAQSGWKPRAALAPTAQLARYQRLSASLEADEGRLDLLVWPEKAYPFPMRHDAAHDYPDGNPRRVRQGFASPLLFGFTAIDVAHHFVTNSAALLDRDGQVRGVYDKIHLIVWSEWLPAFLDKYVPGGPRYRSGISLDPMRLPIQGNGHVPISTFICFESAFPAHVRSLAAAHSQLLVNLSDDSWFGLSAEPDEHMAHAVFRAIETRRDLVRATGSGKSALIAATGEIERQSPISTPADGKEGVTLAGHARLISHRSWYARMGDLFPALCLLCSLVVLLNLLRVRRQARRQPVELPRLEI
jgi:apolipoprotein N-acyltransferase